MKSVSRGFFPPSAAFSHVQASGWLISIWKLQKTFWSTNLLGVHRMSISSRKESGSLWRRDHKCKHLLDEHLFIMLAITLSFIGKASNSRQEQRGPSILFSSADFSHVHLSADCCPQEHFASDAIVLSISNQIKLWVQVALTTNAVWSSVLLAASCWGTHFKFEI